MIGDINKDLIYCLVLADSDINWKLQLQKLQTCKGTYSLSKIWAELSPELSI